MSKDRYRYSYAEAVENLKLPTNKVRHLLKNTDGTYSIMSHTVGWWCDYCDTRGNCVGLDNPVALPYKEDPYENNP